jgi:hypothetical protein
MEKCATAMLLKLRVRNRMSPGDHRNVSLSAGRLKST